MTEYTRAVIAVVKRIPSGKVATYQQVAALAGRPHASRGVAMILNSSSRKHELPWQRVIRTTGIIAFKRGSHNFVMQRRLLLAEKVKVALDGTVDLTRFQWTRRAKKKRNQPKMFG